MQPVTPVDAHVHCYPHFDTERLIRAAEDQLLREKGVPEVAEGVLVLTLTPREGSFADVRDRLVEGSGPERLWSTPEAGVLCSVGGAHRLVFLEGQQVNTKEGLEVLVIGAAEPIVAGLPLLQMMQEVGSERGIAIVPWAAGKWLVPKRRKALSALLEWERDRGWFLGDSRVRPQPLGVPAVFQRAWERGWFILPGSDPMPIQGQERHAGSYGFLLHGRLDPARPLTSFVSALRHLQTQPEYVGMRSDWPSALREQIRLRLSSP